MTISLLKLWIWSVFVTGYNFSVDIRVPQFKRFCFKFLHCPLQWFPLLLDKTRDSFPPSFCAVITDFLWCCPQSTAAQTSFEGY